MVCKLISVMKQYKERLQSDVMLLKETYDRENINNENTNKELEKSIE